MFVDLCNRPWFQRLWTLQEVALARDALVICGSSTIPWTVLVYAVDRLRSEENTKGLYKEISALDATMSGHRITAESVRDFSGTNTDRLISKMMVMALRKAAGEPKDRVFGLYSIFIRLGVHPPKSDYGRNIEDLFCEMASLAIQQDKSLWILDYVNGLDQRQDWPSWVPAWSEMIGLSPVEVDYFKAAGFSEPIYRFSECGRLLTVRRKVIDIIMKKRKDCQCKACRPTWSRRRGTSAALERRKIQSRHIKNG
jgi:hypothetical protein